MLMERGALAIHCLRASLPLPDSSPLPTLIAREIARNRILEDLLRQPSPELFGTMLNGKEPNPMLTNATQTLQIKL